MFPFQKLKENFLKLPDDVQEAITSTQVAEKLQTLTDKYSLQLDEAEKVTEEIGYMMLNLKPKKNFVRNIQNVSGLDYDKSKKLVRDVNNIILKDIRESLKKIHSGENEDDEDLDEEMVRGELLQELENPKEKTTDLIIKPQEPASPVNKQENIETLKQTNFASQNSSLQKEDLKLSEKTEVINPPRTEENNPQSPAPDEQKDRKDYTIDPYREEID